MDIIKTISKLRRYFTLAKHVKEVKYNELLRDTKSLEDFGKLWSDNSEDVLMLTTYLEYQFITETTYNDEQVKAVKDILSRLIKVLISISKERDEYRAKALKDIDK